MTHPLDELARAPLAGLVARAGTAVARRRRRVAAAHGLSTTALGVLAVLADEALARGSELDAGVGLQVGGAGGSGAGAGVGLQVGGAGGSGAGATAGSGVHAGADPVVSGGAAHCSARSPGAGAGVAVAPAGGAGRSHRELAARLGVAPATLTPALDALEHAGAVRRTRDPADRRVVRLAITPDGRHRLAQASPVLRAAVGALPQPSPGDEEVVRRYLLALLAAVAEDDVDGCAR
ncbi:MAG: MarR family transcriptional regulator [Pseudonocardia sp.]